MKLHPRTLSVQTASREIRNAMFDLYNKHDLTYGEIIGIIGEELSHLAKYIIREERHPGEPEKRGDEE